MIKPFLNVLVSLLLLFFFFNSYGAIDPNAPLKQVDIQLRDKAALQRGAKLFMDYCAGCHSLKYMRYNRIAKDIGITTKEGDLDKEALKENLTFAKVRVSDTITTALPYQQSKEWFFGVNPPDLTLTARVHGADWLYTYLLSFYKDPQRPWGANNLLFRDVAMPNVLLNLQGEQIPIYQSAKINLNGDYEKTRVIERLKIIKPGSQSPEQFKQTVKDLVTFLVYVSEPIKLKRQWLGIWVLLFIFIFTILAYLLKREYWRDVT